MVVDWHRRGEQTIMLLHGAGGDHLAWQVQYPALHSAGFASLALDLRGHGYSDRPRGANDDRLERFAEDVYDVLEALEVRAFIMVGHCPGGMGKTEPLYRLGEYLPPSAQLRSCALSRAACRVR
jgi:non-heme chloroperoxidase